MLKLVAGKNLVSDAKIEENNFSIFLLENVSKDQAVDVRMDMESKLVVLEFSSEEDTVMTTLDPAQAVALGTWLMEAGHVLNFASSINLVLTDEDETNG